jgi:hypothetical protein
MTMVYLLSKQSGAEHPEQLLHLFGAPAPPYSPLLLVDRCCGP